MDGLKKKKVNYFKVPIKALFGKLRYFESKFISRERKLDCVKE